MILFMHQLHKEALGLLPGRHISRCFNNKQRVLFPICNKFDTVMILQEKNICPTSIPILAIIAFCDFQGFY